MNTLAFTLLLTLFCLAGCVSSPVISPTQTGIAMLFTPTRAISSETQTITPTAKSTDTPTPSPSPTPAPPTSTRAPTVTPTLDPARAAICEELLAGQGATPERLADFQIAYIKEDGVWVWESASAEARMIAGKDFVPGHVYLSDDGELMMLWLEVGRFKWELWLLFNNGSAPQKLLGVEFFDQFVTEFGDTYGPVFDASLWIPHSHQFVFSTTWIGGFGVPRDDLWFIDADTFQIRQVFEKGEGGNLVFSSDGNLLALASVESISLLDADFTVLWQNVLVYDDPQILTHGELPFYPSPVWSSDSQSLFVAIPSSDYLAITATLTTWEIVAESGTATKIGTFAANDFRPILANGQKLIGSYAS